MSKTRNARFKIGQVVRHRLFPFRGVVFDIDPEFNNTEEWYQSIPAEVRPHKDQPFYHLFAENAETEYIAYVSEQNLLPDTSGKPVRHPQVAKIFEQDETGSYRQRKHETDRLTGAVDSLNNEALPFLQLADEFATRLVIGHAAVVEADDVGTGHGLAAVNDHAGSGLDRHAEWQRHPEHLFRIVFRLDQHCGDDRHARFDPAILAGEADLLGIGLLAFQAELCPWREDELRLLGLRLRLLRRMRG